MTDDGTTVCPGCGATDVDTLFHDCDELGEEVKQNR